MSGVRSETKFNANALRLQTVPSRSRDLRYVRIGMFEMQDLIHWRTCFQQGNYIMRGYPTAWQTII